MCNNVMKDRVRLSVQDPRFGGLRRMYVGRYMYLGKNGSSSGGVGVVGAGVGGDMDGREMRVGVWV